MEEMDSLKINDDDEDEMRMRREMCLGVAKQMVKRNRDVVGARCVKGSDGKIVVEEDKLMEVWRAHYDGISNEEFTWDREGLTNVSPMCGLSERISALEVDAAIGKMKQGKSGGPIGVVSEMLKAAGETGTMCI